MSKRLVHYSPSAVTKPGNHHLPGIERFSHFFKIVNPSVSVIDRTGTLKLPIRTHSLFPIPALAPLTKSFEDLCNDRARELLARANALGVRMYVFWSGGIDSTLVLVSLLKNATAEEEKNITVLLSEESISEYPDFYRTHINGKLAVDSAALFPDLVGTDCMTLGGEHNDALFGAEATYQLMIRFGNDVIHRPFDRNVFFAIYKEKLGTDALTNFYLDLLVRVKDAAPVPIETNHDFIWWSHYALRWQTGHLRMLPFVSSRNIPNLTEEYVRNRFLQFFDTHDFERWSMLNPDKKIKDTWESYKWICKEIIYDFTKDANYRDEKKKRGSLYYLLTQRSVYQGIDNAFTFIRDLDVNDYFDPKNDFVA